jgi:hypothetical protein
LALNSPTSGGRSVGIVLLRTEATDLSFFLVYLLICCLVLTQDTLRFADDQILITKSEDELERAMQNQQKTISDFDMSVSIEKMLNCGILRQTPC